MKAKLIKVGDHYDLYYRDEVENLIIGFASTDGTFERKLSVKNCQEIERGYGLNEIKEIDLSWQDKPILNIEHITKSPNKRMWEVNVETEGPEVDDEGIYCGWNIKKDEDGYLILKIYESKTN